MLPIEDLSDLIEKLRENSASIHELGKIYADDTGVVTESTNWMTEVKASMNPGMISGDSTIRTEMFRSFIRETKTLIIKIFLQIVFLIQDSYIMHQMAADKKIVQINAPFIAQKFIRVNIINITLNYLLPTTCKRNIPAMPDSESTFQLVYILGGSSEDPYLNSLKTIDEYQLEYLFEYEGEDLIDSEVTKILGEFEAIFAILETYLAKKNVEDGMDKKNEPTSSYSDNLDKFLKKKTFGDGTTGDELQLKNIKKRFLRLNNEIKDKVSKPSKLSRQESNFWTKLISRPKHEYLFFKYKFLANGVLHYYLLSVYYLRKVLAESDTRLVEMLTSLVGLIKILASDTMFGHWQFFDLTVDNNTFKD